MKKGEDGMPSENTNTAARKEKLGVRFALEEDLPAVLDIFFRAIRSLCAKGIEQWDEIYPDRKVLSDDIRRKEMRLLEENGIPVSAFVLNEEQMAEYRAVPWKFLPRKFSGESVAVIHRLCVDPEKQGHGFGKISLLCAEEILRNQGFGIVRLDAFSKNPAALRLYESSGYRRAGKALFRNGLFYCYEKKLCPPDSPAEMPAGKSGTEDAAL